MSIDWTKPILWDGKPARALATDMGGYPVVVRMSDGFLEQCELDGKKCSHQRVTNAPERVERWANVGGPNDYCDGVVWHKTKDAADRGKGPGCTTQLLGTFEGDKLVDVAIVPLEGAS